MTGVLSWDALLNKDVAARAKAEWCCNKMAALIDAAAIEKGVAVCPELIVNTLIGDHLLILFWARLGEAVLSKGLTVSPSNADYVVVLTRPSRDWLESTGRGQLPSDYVKYPGKQDHATCVAIRVTGSTE